MKPTIFKKLIEVTETDIKRGFRNDPGQCPIARAMRRKRIQNPSVSHQIIVWGSRSVATSAINRMNTTPKVLAFLKKFDDGGKVKPFKFWLTARSNNE